MVGSRIIKRAAADERGAILVVSAIAMFTLLLVAGYAIDTAIWFVHKKHLQTQADAAALAAGNVFQFGCGSAGDATISNLVHQYDGTGNGLPQGTSVYNPQVSQTPTPSPVPASGHTEYSVVNGSNYQGNPTSQSAPTPADAGLSGSPCTDNVIDVKMTEQSLPSFIVPWIGPSYINTQARVGFQTAVTGDGAPFLEPLPTPSAVAVEFVNEKDGTVLTTPGAVSLTSTDNGNSWSANNVNVNYRDPTTGASNDQVAIGLRVAVNPSGAPATFPCTASESCYDASSTPNLGVAYTRLWANNGTPGVPTNNPVAPQAGDVWLQPCTVSGSSCTGSCPSTPSTPTSNFFASSSSTTEQLCANMTFTSTGGTSLTCSTTSLNLAAGGTPVTMSCPTGGPNGTWSSAPITVPAFNPNTNAHNGAMNITMGWSVQAGCLPVGATGGTTDSSNTCTQGTMHKQCGNGSSACAGSFDGHSDTSPETVQQAYSGAYSLTAGLPSSAGGISTSGSNSGTIASAGISCAPSQPTGYACPAGTANTVQSVQNGTNSVVNINLSFYGFETSSNITDYPFELTLGGNQGNGDVSCAPNSGNGGGNGVTAFQNAIISGCAGNYQVTNVQPASSACPTGSTNATPGPAVCLSTNPGAGKSSSIADALNAKINGSKNAACTSFNYWTSPNSVSQVLRQTYNGRPDPRLLELFYTDNIVLPNGSTNLPIRGFAMFYITGWGGTVGNGTNPVDPCASIAGSVNSNNGLSYTHDTLPPDNADGVIMGHFVSYVSAIGNGSGTACAGGSLDVCVPVLLK
jgi:Putative Flp pilus-assembly TadE/G-like